MYNPTGYPRAAHDRRSVSRRCEVAGQLVEGPLPISTAPKPSPPQAGSQAPPQVRLPDVRVFHRTVVTIDLTVSGNPENEALAELLGAIADRRIRRKVQKLLQLGEEAVRALGELDAALYVRADGEAQIQIVSDAVLSHLRRLLEYLRAVATGADHTGSFELTGPSQTNPGMSTTAPGAARGVGAFRSMSDADKWRTLAEEMEVLLFGLSSELREYDRRLADALSHDRRGQALTDLNDATTALMDGVFAVMTTVYECFLGYAEPERMIPGHRHTLGKALAVRRALAELRRTVAELNRPIQHRATDPAVALASYRLIVESLDAFIASEEFFYLRSDTRKDLESVREVLARGTPERNRNDCEGFDKYLDSLGVISQRGVLIKHDTDTKQKIASELGRALAYATVQPALVCDVIAEAFAKAERLRGLTDPLDDLVERWQKLDPAARADLTTAAPLARALLDLVRPPPEATAPDSDDFF
jgi:hypothetical protein